MILTRRIASHLKTMLGSLARRPELTQDDKKQINELLEKPNIKLDNVLTGFENSYTGKEIIADLSSEYIPHKEDGMVKLIEAFSNCSNLEEQLELFSKKVLPLLKTGMENTNEKAQVFFHLICIMVEHMLFQYEFLIKTNKAVFESNRNLKDDFDVFFKMITQEDLHPEEQKNQIEKPEETVILPFRLTEQEILLQAYDTIYPVVSFVVNTFMAHSRDLALQRMCLIFLQKLYYTFPKFRKNLEEPIITALSAINNEPNAGNKREASVFLYKLIHRDASPEFRLHIEKRDSFKTLYETPYYSPVVLQNEENIYEAINIKDLHAKMGFPLSRDILAGDTYTIYIEIWKPYSILYWGFLLMSHDIDFTIKKIATFEKMIKGEKLDTTLIYDQKKVEATAHHVRGSLIVKEPGIYQIDFDNSSSWWTGKTLKYVTGVLEPDFDVDSFMPGSPFPKEPKKKVIEKESPTAPVTQKKHHGKILHATGENRDVDKVGLIHISSNSINYMLSSKDKAFEIVVNYQPDSIEFDSINQKLLDMTKKMVEIGRTSPDNKMVMKIVYNEKGFDQLVTKEEQTNKINAREKLLSLFSFHTKLLSNLVGEIEISSEVDFVMEKLISDKLYSREHSVYILCIDSHTSTFKGKYRHQNQEYNSLDFNNLCMPVSRTNDVQLKTVTELYFSETTGNKKLGYLACLLVNIYAFYNKEITHIHVIEDKYTNWMNEESQKSLGEMVKEYLSNANKGDSSRRTPEIILNNIKINDYINMKS